MKKIIAVSAGLLLVGSVTVASAEVTFTGDARERLIMTRNYDFGNTVAGRDSMKDYNTGRVRVVINAVTKGGAYANMRLRFADGTYDGSNATLDGGAKTNYYTDWAYIGIPVGPVTINAGLMPDTASLWFRYDKRFDRVAATWANKMTSVTAQFDKMSEQALHAANGDPTFGDMDFNEWGLVVKQKFAADWSMVAYGLYADNQTVFLTAPDTNGKVTDGSGFAGTIRAEGPAGPVKLMAEFSYVQEDLMGWQANGQDVPGGTNAKNALGQGVLQKDGSIKYENGYGGILHAKMNFGPADGTFIIGFTKGGFQADYNYGFLMMGGAMAGADPAIPNVGSPITVISRLGQSADGTASSDTFFLGAIGDYQVNKMIKLVGIVAYANASDYDALELSGLVNFAVTDGAYINLGAGMLAPSLSKSYYGSGVSEDNAYGVFTELGIKF